MGELIVTTIRVDNEDLVKAKKLGLNISQVCRNAIAEAIRRLEGFNPQNKGGIGTEGSDWWTGRDLNPRPSRCQRDDQSVDRQLQFQADLPASAI